MFIGGVLAAGKNKPISNKSAATQNTTPHNASGKPGTTRKGAQTPKTPAPPDFKSYRISSYRIWTCANPKPYFVPAPIAAACAPFSMHPPQNPRRPHSQFNPINAPDPHQGKYIRVFVNSIGRRTLMEMKTPKFPPGSVIVKEKLTTNRIRIAELLTVMVKRAKGYDPQNGDWEYLVTDGLGKKVQQRGKLNNCQACHLPRKEAGYMFRHYLPNEVGRRLR